MNVHDREILRLAIPSIVQNVTVPLLGLADVAIMGHIGQARHIGAIAVGSMVFNVMYWLCGFLRMGTSGLTAQAYGQGETLRGGRCTPGGGPAAGPSVLSPLVMAMSIAMAVGLAVVALQVPLGRLAFWLMRPTADVALLCWPYFSICVWGAPAVLGVYALNGWFVGMQNTRTPMMVAVVQNVLNIVVSTSLVFAFGMGVEGVATGTLVAQWTGFALSAGGAWHCYRRWNGPGRRPGRSRRQPWRVCLTSLPWRRFFGLNRDIFLRTLCLVAVNFYFTSAGAAQGAVILAVNTLLMQLFTLFSYFMDGFAFAGEALAGRYCGAHDEAALRAVVRRLFGWGAAVVVLFTVAYAAGGTSLLRLLTTDAAVVLAAQPFLAWTLLVPLCGVAAFVWDGVFIGITYTRGMLQSCLLAAAAFFAIWFALSTAMGNHALWLALVAYLALRGMAQTLMWMRLRRGRS